METDLFGWTSRTAIGSMFRRFRRRLVAQGIRVGLGVFPVGLDHEGARRWGIVLHRLENFVIRRLDGRLFLTQPGGLAALVRMLCFARRASGQLDDVADHRHDRVVGKPTLARAVIVQDVTEP